MSISESSIHRQKWRQNPVEMPFVKYFENGLESGKKIIIRGQIFEDKIESDQDHLLSIGFYHNGLDHLDFSEYDWAVVLDQSLTLYNSSNSIELKKIKIN